MPSLRAFFAALLTTVLVTALVAAQPAPAMADPIPGFGEAWPRCGTGSDTDGKYCIVSVTRNGSPAALTPNCEVPGDYEMPYIDKIPDGDGNVRFGVTHTVVDSSGCGNEDGSVDPGDVWRFVVNTGSVHPREMSGVVRDVDYSVGGNAADGWRFTLEFRPAPIAWRWDSSGPLPCSYDGGCGDDTTVAGLVYPGFVTGYVTDLANQGLTATELADHTGYLSSYNAQNAYWFYDAETNAIVVRMANPHLRSPGVLATGYYETFVTNGMLIDELHVPDPSSLTGGSFTVRRAGSTTSVPFTVTHEPGGVRIKISGITFSTPSYKIHPKPSAPGQPRWGSATRIAPHAVRLGFRAPIANGGKPVTSYVGRCHRGTGAWHVVRGTSSPLVVRDLPRKRVSCQVRAVNVIGPGRWNPLRFA